MILPKVRFVYDRHKRATKKSPGSIELEVYANRKRKYITTGICLLPKEWADGQVNACRADFMELNEQLHQIKKKAQEIIARMVKDGQFELDAIPKILTDAIVQTDNFLDYAKEAAERKYKKITEGTRKRYKVFFNFMENWKGIVNFADVTERNILKMDDELEKRGLKQASRWNYHKTMKMFIQQAVDDGLVKKNPYPRTDIRRGEESGITRLLTPKEFERFANCKINVKCIERVRDLFVFQTWTMMGYSDLAQFDYNKCTRVGKNIVYKANRQKTKQEFTIVLLPQALAILKKYNNRLPIISIEKYNYYLKNAITYAKIDKPISSHWARHTGATMLLNNGLSIHILQHALGHASIRETEKTYAKLLDDTIINGMASCKKRGKKRA